MIFLAPQKAQDNREAYCAQSESNCPDHAIYFETARLEIGLAWKLAPFSGLKDLAVAPYFPPALIESVKAEGYPCRGKTAEKLWELASSLSIPARAQKVMMMNLGYKAFEGYPLVRMKS